MKKRSSLLALVLCFFMLCACSSNGGQALETSETGPDGYIDPGIDVDSMTPGPEPVQGPENYDRAVQIVSEMALEEKVGQLFFVRYPGAFVAINGISTDPAGYIMFGNDFKDKTPEAFLAEVLEVQAEAKLPLLIGVDEEGGTVSRVSQYTQYRSSKFKSPRELYEEGGFEAISLDTAEKVQLLKSLGINVNLAPVCDVSENSDHFIYQRAFGKGAEETAAFVRTVVEAANQYGMGSVLKHFPGYGGTQDTHMGEAIDNRAYSEFVESDFKPFEEGIKSGAGAVMVSHNTVVSMDSDLPASLSPSVHLILRNVLGFNGVVMTDDLAMGAAAGQGDTGEVAVLAVMAGNDLLITSDYFTQFAAVLSAVGDGRVSEARINESAVRVVIWKLDMGLME